MPRLTRNQNTQLDCVEHFLNLALAELTNDRTVVAMKSAGAATVEFYNERSDQWIAPTFGRAPPRETRVQDTGRFAAAAHQRP
ncbi:hypothetical protein ACFW9F_16975 [Streptomyces sp. NPDC059506]|uniref:hypothetical protein n=1 Tax=Streptomyces sp. NPDC059506 TaxID=3347751 RepID=UPI0036CA7D1E